MIVAPYRTWWVVLWGLVASGLLAAVFLIPFVWWGIATFLTFGTMEAVGVSHLSGSYPPLTRVIRRYVPEWAAYPAIYGLAAGATVEWYRAFGVVILCLMFALVGWFTEHFREAYNGPK